MHNIKQFDTGSDLIIPTCVVQDLSFFLFLCILMKTSHVLKMLAWTMYECSYYKVRLETILMTSCYIIIFTYTLHCVYLSLLGRYLCILYYFMVYCSSSCFRLALHILCPVLICNIINMFYWHDIRLHIVI